VGLSILESTACQTRFDFNGADSVHVPPPVLRPYIVAIHHCHLRIPIKITSSFGMLTSCYEMNMTANHQCKYVPSTATRVLTRVPKHAPLCWCSTE